MYQFTIRSPATLLKTAATVVVHGLGCATVCSVGPELPAGVAVRVVRVEGATLVVDGRVYDHLHYRLRGQNRYFIYASGKNKWKLKFNRGHWFEMPDDYGLSKTTVETLNWTGASGAQAVRAVPLPEGVSNTEAIGRVL